MNILIIYFAIFSTGISSLQMELSLLREAVFVLGSTAFTNSFVISIFLGGLALGAYYGNYLVRTYKGRTREIFTISQLLNIVWIIFFFYTKGGVIYGDLQVNAIFLYFGVATLVPSIVAGMSFSLFLNMLYEKGEKYITGVYAVSTFGNVLSGFLHGIVLIPNYGMTSTYVLAILGSLVAVALITNFREMLRALLAMAFLASGVGFFLVPLFSGDVDSHILWSKDDIHGLVQVIDISDQEGYYDRPSVDVRIDNDHQCASSRHGVLWEFASVDLAMKLLGNQASQVLNAGYCSGASVTRLLEYSSIDEVVSIDMNKTVLEAAELYFPEFHEINSLDERSIIKIDEFRRYINQLPAQKKFDIIILDISLKDPYYHGIFTVEFYEKLKEHLKERGVVFWHRTEQLRTVAEVFPYIYQSVDNDFGFYFFTNFEAPSGLEDDFERILPQAEPGKVYADYYVYDLVAWEEAENVGIIPSK